MSVSISPLYVVPGFTKHSVTQAAQIVFFIIWSNAMRANLHITEQGYATTGTLMLHIKPVAPSTIKSIYGYEGVEINKEWNVVLGSMHANDFKIVTVRCELGEWHPNQREGAKLPICHLSFISEQTNVCLEEVEVSVSMEEQLLAADEPRHEWSDDVEMKWLRWLYTLKTAIYALYHGDKPLAHWMLQRQLDELLMFSIHVGDTKMRDMYLQVYERLMHYIERTFQAQLH
ncbi:hypothetical protein [Paenibacillus sp. 481]|uniref:hypothetical protein n=1 Tax=Paenibacillus sp. 481 TaxID=2835869 RepID=UPI001E35E0C1|nr:hypothetical protein [Paenibacillus sp. 481]UHA72388.1 hypothetical protein KIK04_17125 [Paenibacillus sp. 481]